jgi:hypothetical protein
MPACAGPTTSARLPDPDDKEEDEEALGRIRLLTCGSVIMVVIIVCPSRCLSRSLLDPFLL